MTLIIAADAQDHLILAGDHCAVLSQLSNTGAPHVALDNYRKVYAWKYGAIAASGDVFLMVSFCRILLHLVEGREPIDLLRIGREAKAARTSVGIPPSRAVGNVFFTLPGSDGFVLHMLQIAESSIEHEIIEPISTRFSTRACSLDEAACHAFTSRLRPSFFYPDIGVFHHQRLALLGECFAAQSAFDDLVTASFDAIILDKATGAGTFWQMPEATRRFASVVLPTGIDVLRAGPQSSDKMAAVFSTS